MRQWVWWLLPAVMFRWYFFQISKGLTRYKDESVKWIRLDDELLIIRYPTDDWYKKRGIPLPEGRAK